MIRVKYIRENIGMKSGVFQKWMDHVLTIGSFVTGEHLGRLASVLVFEQDNDIFPSGFWQIRRIEVAHSF